MTEDEDEAIGREALMRAMLDWRRKRTPNYDAWPAAERAAYERGWQDALRCSLENHAELYRRFQPEPPESMN